MCVCVCVCVCVLQKYENKFKDYEIIETGKLVISINENTPSFTLQVFLLNCLQSNVIFLTKEKKTNIDIL